ncbi:MAG: hypothetical protein U1E62_22545 [Alsobacter sp.]
MAANPFCGPVLQMRSGGKPTRPEIIVLAGQHPGEDSSICLALSMRSIALRRADWRQRVWIVPLANESGREARYTRDTKTGIDMNRSWHLTGQAEVDRLRDDLSHARFVVDLHADEFAWRPYMVGPVDAARHIRKDVTDFQRAFMSRCRDAGSRPRPPGPGEDHPGILVNWLASMGVPGVMLELPMRHRRRPIAYPAIRRAAGRQILDALVHAIGRILSSTTEGRSFGG